MNNKHDTRFDSYRKKLAEAHAGDKSQFLRFRLARYEQKFGACEHFTVELVQVLEPPAGKGEFYIAESFLIFPGRVWRVHEFDTQTHAVQTLQIGLPHLVSYLLNPELEAGARLRSLSSADQLVPVFFSGGPGHIRSIVYNKEGHVLPWFLAEKGQDASGDWVPLPATVPPVAV